MKGILLLVLFFTVFEANSQTRNNYTSQGSYEFSRGRYSSAIKLLNKAIKNYPTNARAYFLRGISKSELDDFLGAENDLPKAITYNP
ncbi:MAG: tetratricopeptide repeat protein, partial [Flavobacteriales bacterium]|nr:tetratricopeptide repeat protein [Flavobacteriales bacterium]